MPTNLRALLTLGERRKVVDGVKAEAGGVNYGVTRLNFGWKEIFVNFSLHLLIHHSPNYQLQIYQVSKLTHNFNYSIELDAHEMQIEVAVRADDADMKNREISVHTAVEVDSEYVDEEMKVHQKRKINKNKTVTFYKNHNFSFISIFFCC